MKIDAANLVQVHSVVGFPMKADKSRAKYPYYFSCLPELLFNRLVSQHTKEQGQRGLYGLADARDVAVELITNFPIDPKNELIAGFEIHSFRGSDRLPARLKALEHKVERMNDKDS